MARPKRFELLTPRFVVSGRASFQAFGRTRFPQKYLPKPRKYRDYPWTMVDSALHKKDTGSRQLDGHVSDTKEMSKRQVNRILKVTALAARAGTEGERRAAEAALDRLAAKRQRKRQRKQQRLTDALIKRLPVPARSNRITYDSDVPGFGARVTTGGARSFILNYVTRSGRERRLTIGSCSDWRATAARAEAKRLRQVIDQGGDPLSDIDAERQAPTMAELCDRFEAEHLPRLRASSQADYKRMIANHIRPALKHLKVADVAFEDIDRLHRRITAAGLGDDGDAGHALAG